ncbi:MAG: ribosome recycling factor [Candidatus Magasanikbacteria bacterium]|uniref:Ribosome-recycling factor n=1 Tax=Candidatus Magasanikbacteria bacterium CG10_big_fil_rev_8_21_14_0_10_38_6 TaxID=1974647 RepID=A0A2M6P0Q5_9BACT|nr:ribosome recycling factor [Candidatus Magasanikbacteria bacterium]NCS71716.1 ribosome recycling factor [Candidatus Magasanikbacteria bacterium]PIR77281.1 MAG: ribosome recycling factor [Candidatus Magasanikbacteria bacterium CG10_big_fil_rev_8_21_14_0_10_38_6]
MTIINENKEQFQKAIEFLKQDISVLRTGRATPAIVEDITVEAYGSRQALKALASISVADAKTLTVDPWDKSLMQAVEQAIRNSEIGINPVNDGKLIRLPLPDLTADRRQELIKVLHQKLEHARIAIRKIREEVRGKIDVAEKNKEISEDEKYGFHEDLEKLVKEHNEQIKQIGEDKEKEITTI